MRLLHSLLCCSLVCFDIVPNPLFKVETPKALHVGDSKRSCYSISFTSRKSFVATNFNLLQKAMLLTNLYC